MSSLVVALTDKADRAVDPTPVMQDLTNRVFNVRFATTLPGGFQSCEFSLLLSRSVAYEWYEQFQFHGIHIIEGDESVWEGRISNIAVTDFGVDITCEGYWASMADQTLYSFWSDNDMSKWEPPLPGAGGISNELSITGGGTVLKFTVQAHQDLFVLGLKEGAGYQQNDKGILYYALPRTRHLTNRRVFDPMWFKSMQYQWDATQNSTNLASNFDLKVYTSSHLQGTWTQRDTRRLGTDTPGTRNLDWTTNTPAAILFAIHKYSAGTFTDPTEDGRNRYIVKNVTLYAINDGGSSPDTKADEIMKHLFLGTGPVDNTHAQQISGDMSNVEASSLEVAPAIFENQTMQDIAVNLASFGLDDSGGRLRRTIVGVYGKRRFHFKKQDEENFKWLISVRELGEGGLLLERATQDFWTRVWGRYQDSFDDKTKFTEGVIAPGLENEIFYDERDLVEEFGEMFSSTATKARDFLLLDTKRLPQKSELVLSGAITNVLGAREPLWRVRAGDLFLLQDLAPFPVIRDDEEFGIRLADALRLFSITETEYDASSDSLRIVPDFPPSRLDLFLAQLQLLPSLSSTSNIIKGGKKRKS